MVAIDVSRYVNRTTLDLKVKVLTPMFLGGADGHAELRAAPFKAALRYWWRVTQGDIPHDELLRKEQKLFGGILIKKNNEMKPVKSLVDVSVSGDVIVDSGKTNFETKKTITHPEVKNFHGNPKQINALVYLGMGPIFWNKDKKQMEYNKSRIRTNSEFKLKISFDRENQDIFKAVSLMHHFGGIGGRNRNSWGAFSLISRNKQERILTLNELLNDNKISTTFNKSFKHEYPTGIPVDDDNNFLIWDSSECDNPFDIMYFFAKLYIELRTSFPFTDGMVDTPEERHILGYPVTNHKVKNWEPSNENHNNLNKPKRMKGRMPSQLRFTVLENKAGCYTGRILHLAHKLPKRSGWSIKEEQAIWQKVHKFLDNKMERIKI